MSEGLYNKYTVINNQSGEVVESCFVLRPQIDLAARATMYEYANRVRTENPVLASEIEQSLKIEELGEREQELKSLLHRILSYTSESQAHTAAAHIHYWIKSSLKTIYGEEEI